MSVLEVFGSDGKRKAIYKEEKTFPPLDVLMSMKQGGYTFKLDGKKYVPKGSENKERITK